jgi:hypothetical protein
MRHGILRFPLLALVLSAAAPASAQAQTSMTGGISGRELCEQAVCGAAIFVAGFAGQIDGRPTVGLAIGAIQHTQLPQAPGECATIVGGSWSITTLRRTLAGEVPFGGTVCYVDGVKYLVNVTLKIDQGGSGQSQLCAVLDHGPFPPTIKGAITQ